MNNNLLVRSFKVLFLAIVASAMIGCASVTMPPPSATASTVENLRTANIVPATAGKFALAPGVNPEVDKSLGGLRGSSLQATSGSFSQQLKEVIIAELKAAGLYDEKSPNQIEGQLMESQVDAAVSVGTARLSAKFTVDRNGKRVFDKVLSVESQWESSFVGAIALPAAIHQYSLLYKTLAAKLFEDKDFKAALAR